MMLEIESWCNTVMLVGMNSALCQVPAPIASRFVNLQFQYKDRIEFVIVESISVEGAFAKAVEGVELVVHTASPVPLGGLDFVRFWCLLLARSRKRVGLT